MLSWYKAWMPGVITYVGAMLKEDNVFLHSLKITLSVQNNYVKYQHSQFHFKCCCIQIVAQLDMHNY